MQPKLILIPIIVAGLFALVQSGISVANAATDTASVMWADEFSASQPQPVNIASLGLPLKYSVGGIDPGTFTCTPDQTSINHKSVSLTGPNGTSHPIYTVSYSTEPIGTTYFHFNLSIILPYYELSQNTQYQLTFNGGVSSDSSTLRFKCGTQPNTYQYFYLPAGAHTLTFSTGPDTIKPTILDRSVITTLNQAVIIWKASEPVSPQVKLSQAASGYESVTTAQNYGLWYVAKITNLSPGESYTYHIQAYDQGGNQPTLGTTGNVTTWEISPITIFDQTGHEASIKWATSVKTDSIIEYGTTKNLGQISGKHSSATNHTVRLVHLQSNQTYYARIRLVSGNASSVSDVFSFKTLDASAAVSTDATTINPQFAGQFDLSNFNFKDFPQDQPLAENNQASTGAVLASQDTDLVSIAKNYRQFIQQHRWVVWLWVPVLLLLFLIACIWLLHRHQHKAAIVQQELAKQKARKYHQPPSLG